MHTIWHRANALVTFFGTVAGVLAIITASTDLIHKTNPSVKVSLAEVKKLSQYHGGRDQAVVTFNLDADLRSIFSWNTKQLFVYLQAEYVTSDNKVNQVVLWDSIITQKDKALIRLKKHKTKYAFIDHGSGLRNTQLNLTLVWDVMPRVGFLYMQRQSFDAGRLPGSYQY